MVEISTDTMLLVLVVMFAGISIVMFKNHYEKKLRSREVYPESEGVKKKAQRGQEDAVETLKDLTAESIKFLKDTNNELRADVKKLKASVSWYKSQMYGDGRIDDNDQKGAPSPPTGSIKTRGDSTVSEDVVQMRLRMIADKINIPPELLMFEDVNSALSEIASSPDFDKIAAAALKSSNSNPNPSNGKVEGITYV